MTSITFDWPVGIPRCSIREATHSTNIVCNNRAFLVNIEIDTPVRRKSLVSRSNISVAICINQMYYIFCPLLYPKVVHVRSTVKSPIVSIIPCAFHSHNDTSGDKARILTDYSCIGSALLEYPVITVITICVFTFAVNGIGICFMLKLFADALIYKVKKSH